jgi:DNA-binding MarR family transcriptional regulator
MGNRAQFGKVLLSVVRAVDRMQRDEICCGDLTLQQFDTLKRISTAERSTLGSVAQELEIDLSTASRNLTRLEKQGYVSKDRDASDARTVILRLTPRGKRALSTLSCDERDALAAVYDRISAGRRAEVIAGLAVLTEALEKTRRPSSEDACCPPSEGQTIRRLRTGPSAG